MCRDDPTNSLQCEIFMSTQCNGLDVGAQPQLNSSWPLINSGAVSLGVRWEYQDFYGFC